ncbi:hypothetical protein KL867_19420 [Ruegeria litorea]|uniref:Uncharacterized protein n=1 Tax=Falsiruegeria litorea TaxID=1280831 RepID=A0ABS5WVS0_9RHOB|nr:hypothetical protein [Falsiruegeria litorea]MBT3143240.1 hypothetical protein [Falsiruegeria litorea]
MGKAAGIVSGLSDLKAPLISAFGKDVKPSSISRGKAMEADTVLEGTPRHRFRRALAVLDQLRGLPLVLDKGLLLPEPIGPMPTYTRSGLCIQEFPEKLSAFCLSLRATDKTAFKAAYAKGADEEVNEFTQRIGHTADEDQPDDNGPDGGEWDFGYNRRSVGSLHIDTITVAASDLARRGVLAVYPVGGWWKENRNVDPERCVARFSLVVEIDATEAEADLYAEVQQRVAPQAAIQV